MNVTKGMEVSNSYGLERKRNAQYLLSRRVCPSQGAWWQCPGSGLNRMALSLWSFPEWFCFLSALYEPLVLLSPCLDSKEQRWCWNMQRVKACDRVPISGEWAECHLGRKGSQSGSVPLVPLFHKHLEAHPSLGAWLGGAGLWRWTNAALNSGTLWPSWGGDV